MAKKTNILLSFTIGLLVILILLISSLLYFFGDDIIDLYSYGIPIFELTEYDVPVELSCDDYNIPIEYRNAYGNADINALENGCNIVGGIYTERYNELSCYWNPAVYFLSCDDDNINEFGRFCVDRLQGNFECDSATAYVGCYCNIAIPSMWVGDEPDYDWGENETYEELTLCSDVLLPKYGDLGGICRDEGWCPDDAYSCEHYWDYNNQEHKCGCSELYFCGQLCYEYYYTTPCECPPGSTRETITRSTFQCVPDGHECFEGNVI